MTVQEWKKLVAEIYTNGDCNDSIIVAVGETGIGKSEVVRQVAEEFGCEYQDVWFSQMEGPGDYLGRTERTDVEVNGIAKSITKFAVPSFFPMDGAGILSIEEVFSTPPDLVEAFKSIVSYRQLGDWICPPDWVIVGTTNPYDGDTSHEYNTFEVDLAVRQRIITVEVVADYGEWMDWGRENGLYDPMITFLDNDPSRWSTAPPRAWKQLSDWSYRISDKNQLIDIAISLLGDTVGASYIQSISETNSVKPITINDIIDTNVDVKSMVEKFIDEGKLDVMSASADNLRSVTPDRISEIDETLVERFASVVVAMPIEAFATICKGLSQNHKALYAKLAERDDVLSKVSGNSEF